MSRELCARSTDLDSGNLYITLTNKLDNVYGIRVYIVIHTACIIHFRLFLGQ